MTISSTSLSGVTPPAIQSEVSSAERRSRWFEVFLVLAISLGLPLLNSLYLLKNAPAVALRMTTLRSLYGIAHEGLSLMLLAYVLSRRKLRLRDLGLRWSKRDVIPSFVVTILSAVAYIAGALLLQLAHYGLFGTISRGPHAERFFAGPTIAAVPFMLLNPFFEELIVRAYLMREIKALTGSTAMSVISSVVLQASYHLYYGWFGALAIACLFLVFALYYARSGRAVPIVFAHAAFDLYALFRLM
jgi:membrane protease YdiL (CAAX protease family)